MLEGFAHLTRQSFSLKEVKFGSPSIDMLRYVAMYMDRVDIEVEYLGPERSGRWCTGAVRQ